jgi:hypothetical protein
MHGFTSSLLLAAIVGCGTASPDSAGYVNDQQGTSLANVFNTKTKWLSFQDQQSADVEKSSEFAGQFVICSTDELHCISGPLNLVVPKQQAAGSWQLGSTRCTTTLVANDRLRGECVTGAVTTNYEFEERRGLTKYQLRTDPGPYILRGAKGLFAD